MLLTTRHGRGLALAIALSSVSAELTAQLTRSDYERAARLRERYEYATLGVAETPSFIGKSRRFQYRRSVSGGHEFVVVDADSLERRPAFDHDRLAAALGKLLGETMAGLRLPFQTFSFEDGERLIRFTVGQSRFACELGSGETTCLRDDPKVLPGTLRGVSGPVRDPDRAPEVAPKASPDGRWVSVNRALAELLGYRAEELIGAPAEGMLHPDDRPVQREALRLLLAGECPSFTSEQRCIRRSGEAMWGLVMVSLVSDADRRPRHLVYAVQDIGDRKRIEADPREPRIIRTVHGVGYRYE